MKQGKSLQDLAAEVQRQAEMKKDYKADTRQLSVVPMGGNFQEWDAPALRIGELGTFGLNETAHGQIAGRTGIPKKYYDRLLTEAPNLLALNVNHWFREQPGKRLVRTLDDKARAFLSDRYRILDNEEVLESALVSIRDMPDVNVVSCEVTERRLYLKCTFPSIQREVEVRGKKVGDIVEAGFVLSNSEIGLGSVNVNPLVFRLSCLNGAVMSDSGLRKYHVGRGSGESEHVHEFYKDDTLQKADEAFLLKLRDVVRGAADESRFKALVDRMSRATEQQIEGDIPDVIEEVKKKFSLTDGEKNGVLEHLVRGGDLSQWGMANAVTRMSQDVSDYDRASELERVGGQIIELQPRDWRVIGVQKAA